MSVAEPNAPPAVVHAVPVAALFQVTCDGVNAWVMLCVW